MTKFIEKVVKSVVNSDKLIEQPNEKVAEKTVSAAVETIIEEVRAGNVVTIQGFGTFKTVAVAERKGRNPQTGDEIIIPAHKKVVFKPSKQFKEKVNGQI